MHDRPEVRGSVRPAKIMKIEYQRTCGTCKKDDVNQDPSRGTNPQIDNIRRE